MSEQRSSLDEVAPGNYLQQRFLRRRIRALQAARGTTELRFCDNGAGKGTLSTLFLELGLSGIGSDLHTASCRLNEQTHRDYIAQGRYNVFNESFLDQDLTGERFDIVFTSMVLGLITDEELQAYFAKFKNHLTEGGLIINLVQASMKHWSIEDETVGHLRRFSYDDFRKLSADHGLAVKYMAGLCYPLSNWLLPLSSALISRTDKNKVDLPREERSELSGIRHVPFKNIFPSWTRFVVNDFTLSPFYALQLLFRNHPSCMVIYSEIGRDGSRR